MTQANVRSNTHRKAKKQKRFSKKAYLLWGTLVAGILLAGGLYLGYYNYTHYKAMAEFTGGKVTREGFIATLHLETGKYDPIIWKDDKESLRIKREILEKIVEENILLAEAKKAGVGVTESELKQELDSYKSGYTEETFRKMLKLKGISYNEWAEKKKNKYLIQKLIKKEVIDNITISNDEINTYYKENPQEFTHPEQVRARHILVSTYEEAQKIYDELNTGGNFATIAKEMSISPERSMGGDLGYFSRGTHPAVFDRVCFNLSVGSTSNPVKSEYGYHIFRIIGKKGPVKEVLEEAKGHIIEQLKKQKSKDAFDKWFEPIYEKASVRINHDLLERIEVNLHEENSK